jgi:hypothetical protein
MDKSNCNKNRGRKHHFKAQPDIFPEQLADIIAEQEHLSVNDVVTAQRICPH